MFTIPNIVQHSLTPFSLQGDCVVNKRDIPEDGNIPGQLPSVWTRTSDTRTGLPIHKGAAVVRRRVLKEEWMSFKAACKKAIDTQMDLRVFIQGYSDVFEVLTWMCTGFKMNFTFGLHFIAV